MFRQFARLPLRRCLHSQAGAATPRAFGLYNRSAYALGATVTVGTFLAWSWNSDSRHIALDSEVVPAPKKHTGAAKPTSTLPPSDTPAPAVPSPSPSEQHAALKESGESPEAPPPAPAEGEGEQEESSGGAFNPETGEINWDCPCLGGMAHGPCGQHFREAFSCFVFSEQEPKGIDCVEKFKAMQDCFREHPDVYGAEIMDDDDDEGLAESVDLQKPAEGDSFAPETPSSPETTEQQPAPAAS